MGACITESDQEKHVNTHELELEICFEFIYNITRHKSGRAQEAAGYDALMRTGAITGVISVIWAAAGVLMTLGAIALSRAPAREFRSDSPTVKMGIQFLLDAHFR